MTARAAAPGPRLLRRHLLGGFLLALPLLLAACETAAPPPTDFPPLTYGYLSKLRLNVATVDIEDSVTAEGSDPQHVEALAPVRPVDALRQMAQDRLLPAGTAGHAVFIIQDASLLRAPGGFAGTMHVRLDISTSEGAPSGFADARVSRTYATSDTSEAGTRAALYDLVKLMMSDMNVELEYQVKHQLRDYLQPGDQTAPPPPPVQMQDLNTGTPMPATPIPGTDQPPPPPPQ
jgi:hypothetical protein